MKKLTLIFLCMIFMITPVFAEYSEANIMPLLNEMKIMQGDPDGNLRLNDAVSRAEFTKVAVTASVYKNSVATNLKISPFKDVTHAHWSAPYVKLASDSKMITGYPDSSFRPDNTVLYEEAVTVYLKLLGYTDADFGSSWPYGQVGLAMNIGLCDGLQSRIGDQLTRRDVAYLTYNLLNAQPKNSNAYYIESLNYKIAEDVVVLGTPLTDSSVGSGRINTTSGNYRTARSFDDMVGKKGDLIIKNSNEAVSFIPSEQYVDEYLVYQVLDDNVVVSKNGSITSLSVDTNLTVYHKSQTTTLKNMMSSISVGDTLKIYRTRDMVTDYGVISTELLKGPITATSKNAVSTNDSTTFIRNGVQSSGYELNDILYYSEQLNTVWAYSKRVAGIYESASPNRDNPTSVIVSGVSYQLEGSNAFYQLSSKGSIQYGDSVTLLLGRDGKVADVLTGTSQTTVGYLIETGRKNFKNSDGSEYSSYYVEIVNAQGEALEYPTDSDYSASRNKIVTVSFKNQKTKISTTSANSTVSGTFSYKNNKIGSHKLADDVLILEVSTVEPSETGTYISVYPQRIDGVSLSASSILYVQKNTAGEITALFLKDVTGDSYQYGIITDASKITDKSTSRSYTYDINGVSTTTNGGIFTSVIAGEPYGIAFSGNSIERIISLSKISSPVSQITDFSVLSGGTEYTMSDKVAVYQMSSDYKFMKLSKNDLIDEQDDYTVYAYYDKAEKYGGRIRVLIAKKKIS